MLDREDMLQNSERMNAMLNFRQLEQDIEAMMHKAHAPGLALAIVQEHTLIYAKGDTTREYLLYCFSGERLWTIF